MLQLKDVTLETVVPWSLAQFLFLCRSLASPMSVSSLDDPGASARGASSRMMFLGVFVRIWQSFVVPPWVERNGTAALKASCEMLKGGKRGQNNWSWTQKLEFRGVGGKMSGRAKQLEHGRRWGPVGQWDRAQQLGMELPRRRQLGGPKWYAETENASSTSEGSEHQPEGTKGWETFFFSFLTNSQKSLAKIELSNKEELKIG